MRARLVHQVLVERHSFTRGMDPGEAMDVGLRVKIKAWLDDAEIKHYTINDDLTVDVDGNVDLRNRMETEFPSHVRFGMVTEGFYCAGNSLVSLVGCPKIVGGNFNCDHNLLVSLEESPKTVVGYFSCSHNRLKSLGGSPKMVGGNFYCDHNRLLTSLEGCPEKVGRHFYCSGNTKHFAQEDVEEFCDVAGEIYV